MNDKVISKEPEVILIDVCKCKHPVPYLDKNDRISCRTCKNEL
jgi:hypothetical protein